MKRSLPLLMIALAAACATDTSTPPDAPVVATATYRADESPFPVGAIPNAVIHDSQRNKDVEMVIDYPSRGTGPFPVIVFSHGFGGSKDSYVALTEYWAGHGYVCIKPNHADAGALKSIMEKRREEMQQRRDEMRQQGRSERGRRGPREGPDLSETIWQSQSAADWRNRARDITAVIDSLDQLEQKYPELQGKMDHAKIGVAGHSYGAFSAMFLAGMRSYVENPPLQFSDPRARAAIAMSPQGLGSERGLTQESWANVHVPIMYMTGSNDRSGQQHDAVWRKDPYIYGPAGDKYFVSIEGAGHMAFAGGQGMDDQVVMINEPTYRDQQGRYSQPQSRGVYPGLESSRRAFDAIKMTTLAFWDAFLKGEATGRDYLNGSANTLNGGKITIERK